jgi:2,4-dienoyl-CoA reductase-like NADH-dependent reductase (Old Yellow Enzyme family)
MSTNKTTKDAPQSLRSSYELKPGIHLSNRLVKASTEELLGEKNGRMTERMLGLYDVWGKSGIGMILTGNMFVSEAGKSRNGNLVVYRDERGLQEQSNLASRMQAHGAKGIVQINHAGRQALAHTGVQPIAPSPIQMQGYGGLFKTPRAATNEELEQVVQDFVESAVLLEKAGFAGVEIHAAHGYLLSQFLSPLLNQREDKWGGSLRNRASLLLQIVERVQEAVSPSFIVGVKLNSADFQRGGFGEDDSLQVIEWLSEHHIDFLEISGGNYESPAMMGNSSTNKREAYFLSFAKRVRAISSVHLLVTGGFRSSSFMDDCIRDGECDLIGIARPMIVEPDLPMRLLADRKTAAVEVRDRLGIKMLDNMLQTFWYKRQMAAIAKTGRPLGPRASRIWALLTEIPKVIWA